MNLLFLCNLGSIIKSNLISRTSLTGLSVLLRNTMFIFTPMNPLGSEGGIGFDYVRDLDSDLSSSISKPFLTHSIGDIVYILRSVVDLRIDIRGSTSNFPPQPWIPGIPEALFSKWEFQVTSTDILLILIL